MSKKYNIGRINETSNDENIKNVYTESYISFFHLVCSHP